MSGGGRRKKVHHEEHADERWLVTFADMMVLLVAVFIVLWAMSSANISKTKVVAESISKALSSPVLSGGKAIKETGGESNTEMLESKPANTSLAMAMKEAQGGTAAEQAKAAKEEERQLEQLKQQVDAYASANGLAKTISTTVTPDGLSIRLNTDGPFFDSGSAALKPGSRPILAKVAGLLRSDNHYVRVLGHTDAIPTTGSEFATNWELSTARASAVVRALQRNRVAPARLEASGRSSLDAVATNATDEGRAENRRVELLLPRRQEVNGTESTTP
jgi:chemotaxis protein MotB